MKIYYSAETEGFYNDSDHKTAQIPSDAVEITKQTFDSLMLDQVNGKIIVDDGSGRPIATDANANETLQERLDRTVLEIKSECNKRVTAKYPITSQINILADWLAGDNQTAFDDMRTFINALRDDSDALKASSALLSFDDLLLLDVADNTHWSV